MKKQFFRRGCYICWILIWAVFFLWGCETKETNEINETREEVENPGIKITFFDVGKGDAILIETAEHTMLIDAGYEKTAGSILDYFKEQGIEHLDYLTVTHFDKDHVGGADWILKNLEVGEVLQPDYESDSGQYLEYCAAMDMKKISPTQVKETMKLSFDGADFLIYPPQQETYEEEDNDFSLVIRMQYKNRSFLFAGDCEEERLKELLDQKEFDISHDVLKVPHHGKKESNSREFLEAVSPQIAVITCSEEEMPSDKIREILDELGTEVYLTKEGTLTCLCDGETVEMF